VQPAGGGRNHAPPQRGEARPRAAAWSVAGGIPGTVAGALLSRLADGPVLLIVSGAVLAAVGLRVLLPADETALAKGAERRHHRALLAASMALVGVFTGLLANGGGFAPADDLTAVFIQLVMPIFPPSVPRSFITPVTAQGALTMLSGLLCEIMAVEAMFSVPWLL
jgi:sulfite exporter TauE/SafE